MLGPDAGDTWVVISIAIILLLLVASFVIVLTSFTALEDKVQWWYQYFTICTLQKFPSAAITGSYSIVKLTDPKFYMRLGGRGCITKWCTG